MGLEFICSRHSMCPPILIRSSHSAAKSHYLIIYIAFIYRMAAFNESFKFFFKVVHLGVVHFSRACSIKVVQPVSVVKLAKRVTCSTKPQYLCNCSLTEKQAHLVSKFFNFKAGKVSSFLRAIFHTIKLVIVFLSSTTFLIQFSLAQITI